MENLIFIITGIILYIFFIYNKNSLKLIEAHNGNKYYVRDEKDKLLAANLLAQIEERLYKIRDHCISNIDNPDYDTYRKYFVRLKKKFHRNRTQIYENTTKKGSTSYSVNKGEELVFCIRHRKKNKKKLHNINTVMYVAIHELAHIACPEIGHTPLFNQIFRFLLNVGIEIGVYTHEKYRKTRPEYCGMTLNTNIIHKK
jgi:hypothetical protein